MATLSPSEAAPRDEAPIEVVVGGVVERLRAHADQPESTLTCNDLLGLVGVRSHVVAILLFSLLNLIPAPPGYNFVMALIIIALCVSLLLQREMQFRGPVGRMRLPLKVMLKLMDVRGRLANWAARVSSPRWRPLAGQGVLPIVALTGILLGLFMLPPIPATNTLPSIGLAIMCVGILNHDGLVVVTGMLVGIAGAIVCGLAVWLVIIVGFAIGEAVEGELAPEPAPISSSAAPA